MAVSEVEAVLEFLRRNGLSDSESALMEDIVEKSKLKSFDFEKFVFPMVPPPPPLRIPPAAPQRRLEAAGGGGDESTSQSSDDFVSLGSSITDLCSSDFTNPYGMQSATHGDSETSSDRLSQFGTARDYHDFDTRNDQYWYNEKTEDYDSPPCFDESDTYGCPSEDKFVMTLGTQKKSDSELSLNNLSEGLQLDKPWPFKVPSMDDLAEVEVKDYYHLDQNAQPNGGGENEKAGCTLFSCSNPLYECCIGARGFIDMNVGVNKTVCNCASEHKISEDCNYSIERSSARGWDGEIKSSAQFRIHGDDKDIQVHKKENYEVGNGGNLGGEVSEPEAAADEDEDVIGDEPPVQDTNDHGYEVFSLRIIHRKNRTGFEENKDLPILLNSIIAGRYYVTEYLGSAAFSKVIQAHDLYTGIDVCLKIIKNDKDFFDQSLDEIKLLKFVNKHDPGDERHILRLYDYFYYQEHLFIVCELLRANLYEFQKFNRESGGEPYFTLSRLQFITRQCLDALEYMHHLGIIHCDLKPENILIKSYSRCEIKVIDLGSSCFLTDNLCLYIQSRSYRAPEVILGLPYDQKIDLWSLGCILAELCTGEVLFPNDALIMILARMIGMLGPIDVDMLVRGQETNKYFTEEYDLYHVNEETNQLEYIIPEESALEHHLQVSDSKFIDFIKDLLEINPQRRLTASEALEHPWLSHTYT